MKKVHAAKLILGIALFILGVGISFVIITGENRQNRENTVVEATVTGCIMTYEEYDIVDGNYDRKYRIGVAYTYDGEDYESFIDSSSKKSIGKTIRIHIDPEDPIKTDGMYGGMTDYIAPILFVAVPFALVGICLTVSALPIRKGKKQEE